MKLFYAKTSPYARKLLLLARHLGQTDAIDMIDTDPLEATPEFLEANPLSKVPALVVAGEPALFDSRVIAEFLLDRAGQNDSGRVKTELLKRQALADGITDAAVAIVQESRRPEAQQSPYWVERWTAAIERGVAHLEDGAVNALDHWRLDAMATACALDYLNFRLPELAWESRFPDTAKWYQAAVTQADMIATDPR